MVSTQMRNGGFAVAAVAAYFGAFGIHSGLILLCSLISFLVGSIVVCLYFGKKQSDLTYGQAKVPLAPTSVGIPRLVDMMEEYKENELRRVKLDKRLTGASNIDEQLQEILDFVFRDYIEIWYKEITDDTQFMLELRKVFNRAISNFASRSKEIDWIPFLTQKLVDELATHAKLYRRADQKYQQAKKEKDPSEPSDDEETASEEIERAFFEYENEMAESVSRESVSTNEEIEHKYLQEIVEALLFYLLPDEEFDQTMFRFLVREVLVQGVIAPTIEKMSDPDYMNQNMIWMCYDSTLTSDAFLTTLKMSTNMDEVRSVLEKVNDEMARSRSKDTGGVDDSSIKQTLSSLSFLERVCKSQIGRIAAKSAAGDVVDGIDMPSDFHLQPLNTKDLPFVFVLANDLGMQYYNDYLITYDKAIYLNILLDIECYNKIAAPQLQGADEESLDLALNMIADIHDKYFTETISSLDIDMACVEPVLKSLEEKKPSVAVFDSLHDVVMESLEKYYEDFKKHDLYYKMIRDLDLDTTSSFSEDSADITSMTGSIGDPESERPDTKISASIVKTGIVKEKLGGKSYAVYSIQVTEISISGAADDRQWQTTRRYSDFYDLYIIISDKYSTLRDLPFPGKRTFNNMKEEFLERRANALTEYLQMVLDSETYQLHSSLQKIMSGFLQGDSWEKPKMAAPVKVGAFVNPLRLSMKQKMNKVKSVPDVLFGDVLDGFGKMLTKHLSIAPTLSKNQFDRYRVAATLDTEDDDNIPMRIMLLLLDEVFDLRKKNQWLRRRIVAILRQIIKATYGDRINRRIVDHVEMLTSSDQVAEFIRQLKERFWPSGLPAEPTVIRDKQTRLRTGVICKAKMLGSVPDELRHMIGTETTRAGVLRIFTMCQHKRLNKRLIYVILEGVLQTLFPQSQFDKRFRQIHMKSQRGRADSSLSQADV